MSVFTATVLTLFPEMFPASLGHSLAGKALENQHWALEIINIRDFATDKHGSVDDTPYGGGAGMVLRPDILAKAFESIAINERLCYYLSPRGKMFSQNNAVSLAKASGVVLICGRYEGVDQRFLDAYAIQELSIGDYVLSGGEIAAQVVLDAVVRLLPHVIGNQETHTEESFSKGLLEYPHYTRPSIWQNRAVPEVLLSGHHGNVAAWRKKQAEHLTKARRPDLWADYILQQQEQE